jgi:hypothetical protein
MADFGGEEGQSRGTQAASKELKPVRTQVPPAVL